MPESQIQVLRDVAVQVKQRAKVYERWGFGGKSKRGLEISALFAGLSGTGKTMAAEVLARKLQLDLYRIDLSAVVSKYIGEIEKNLGRVFDAAELGGVVLLFDEVDVLFGKRSQVKDSHERHANVEVNYLLQRMESYRRFSVLTTNLKSSAYIYFSVGYVRYFFSSPYKFGDRTTRFASSHIPVCSRALVCRFFSTLRPNIPLCMGAIRSDLPSLVPFLPTEF